MGVLRCTAKYRRLFGLPDKLREPAPPNNALGAWYANILNVGHGRYLHYMSERARLSVIVSLRTRDTAEQRFPEALFELLLQLGVGRDHADQEAAMLSTLDYGHTTSRSVLGSMRDQALTARYCLSDGISLMELMMLLAHTPCGPLNYDSPDRVAPQLVKKRWDAHEVSIVDYH